MKGLLLALATLAAGCAFTTPAPGGPLHPGSTTQVEMSWAVAYGRARATVDGASVAGNGQAQVIGRGVEPLPNPVPLTLGVRQALGANLEGSADIGWMDSGVGLRVRLPPLGEDALPIVLGAGARTGSISAFGGATYEGRLGLELYPDISARRDRSSRLILAVGVAAGQFAHEFILPDIYHSASDAPTGPPFASLLRHEVRLQTALGLYWTAAHGSFSVAVSPWILLHAAAPPSIVCHDCNGSPVITDFAQTWGAALIVTPGVHWWHAI